MILSQMLILLQLEWIRLVVVTEYENYNAVCEGINFLVNGT